MLTVAFVFSLCSLVGTILLAWCVRRIATASQYGWKWIAESKPVECDELPPELPVIKIGEVECCNVTGKYKAWEPDMSRYVLCDSEQQAREVVTMWKRAALIQMEQIEKNISSSPSYQRFKRNGLPR